MKSGFDTYNPDAGHLPSWLATGFIRHALKKARAMSKKLVVERLAPPPDIEEPASETQDPLQEMLPLLPSLSSKDRETIELVILQELTYEEAAERSRFQPCTPNAMKTRKCRAAQRLRALWTERQLHGET
jgi:DNA-directed RNA polymerase specialized sigma24 family protein